jgi:hypothetical protein
VLVPELELVLGLESVDSRLAPRRYKETERRKEGRRGRRVFIAEGSKEYSIDTSVGGGVKSAERDRE